MEYSQMLNQMINDSGLSLRKITALCEEKGYNITPSYISQLKNGKLAPPSEDISKALSEVCNDENPMKLIFQGYLEKAPEMIKKYILMSAAINKLILKDMSLNENFITSDEYKEYIHNLDALSSLDISAKYIHSDGDIADVLHEEINALTGGVYSKDKEETTKDTSYFFLRDHSMEPIVNINAHVQTVKTKKEFIKNKDIIAFYIKESRTPQIRRVFMVKDQIVLVPENSDHDVYTYPTLEDIDYIGKVVSYKMNF